MRHLALVLGAVVAAAFAPLTVSASGSAGYGDPPGWCTRYSDMWTSEIHTRDPLVGTNPERDTFYGFHANPGYDDWYGYFYGDFRGVAGDRSGWVKLLHEDYPNHYSWNFASNGWAVHGHAKQYIAYYNWTFGGQCGMGRYGSGSPAPYMADQYGWPVVDIYVDANPPYPPVPHVIAATPDSVSFTWDPVADQGDGAGQDFYESGLDHYTSWVTIDGGPPLHLSNSAMPITLVQPVPHGHDACVHVVAEDRVFNRTADQSICARALTPPPMPEWAPLTVAVKANPAPAGLVGLDSWLWLDPTPGIERFDEKLGNFEYSVIATPVGATWDFGDGEVARYGTPGGFGVAFPLQSAISHVFQAHSRLGYVIGATVTYSVSWSALVGGTWVGPYPMGSVDRVALPLVYPVQQAQPEVVII